jgi:hypothetical protein
MAVVINRRDARAMYSLALVIMALTVMSSVSIMYCQVGKNFLLPANSVDTIMHYGYQEY